MSIILNNNGFSLQSVLRPAPSLAPEDSLARFVQTLRFHASGTLPVIREGKFCGMVHQQDILPLLANTNEAEREKALEKPIETILRLPIAILKPEMSLSEAGQLFAQHSQGLLPVVDEGGYCLGVVLATDLLIPEFTQTAPPRIGGMATPFGVYLTEGTIQAGVGNFALIASGALLCFLMLLSVWVIKVSITLLQNQSIISHNPVWNLAYEPPANQPLLGMISLGLQLLVVFVFLSLMRVTRIAGYHAAEHQTVYALEREERLIPAIVGRMPRPHPRCGTNLMAASLVFFFTMKLLHFTFLGNEDATMLAAIVSLFTWKKVGTFLQAFFTTRPASQKELASGIAAGKELIRKYYSTPPTRIRFLKKLWNMGLIQTMIGFAIVSSLAEFLLSFF